MERSILLSRYTVSEFSKYGSGARAAVDLLTKVRVKMAAYASDKHPYFKAIFFRKYEMSSYDIW